MEAHIGLFTPQALEGLANYEQDEPLQDAIGALSPRIVDWPDEQVFLNVNAPEDLLTAASALHHRRA